MPVLNKDTAFEFVNYLQRKVQEHFPDFKTYEGTDRHNSTVKFNKLESIITKGTSSDSYISTSRRFLKIYEIIEINDIPIKLKVCGKLLDLRSEEIKSKLKNDLPLILDKTSGWSLSFRSGFGDPSINAIRRPLTDGYSNTSLLTQLILYSHATAKLKGVVFPSGKLSNKGN